MANASRTKTTNRRTLPDPISTPLAGEEDRLQAIARRYKEELPWADADAIEIFMGVLRMHRILAAATARYYDSLGLGFSMTGARHTLLLTLYFVEDHRLPQNEISRELGVSRTNITNLIDGLERDDLVTRIPNPADRRVSYAQLTPRGEQLCATLLPILTRFMEETCSDFDRGEKEQFKGYLRRFRRDVRARYLTGKANGASLDVSQR
jgi:DNA-binding MarR family transcriptional regulator